MCVCEKERERERVDIRRERGESMNRVVTVTNLEDDRRMSRYNLTIEAWNGKLFKTICQLFIESTFLPRVFYCKNTSFASLLNNK